MCPVAYENKCPVSIFIPPRSADEEFLSISLPSPHAGSYLVRKFVLSSRNVFTVNNTRKKIIQQSNVVVYGKLKIKHKKGLLYVFYGNNRNGKIILKIIF